MDRRRLWDPLTASRRGRSEPAPLAPRVALLAFNHVRAPEGDPARQGLTIQSDGLRQTAVNPGYASDANLGGRGRDTALDHVSRDRENGATEELAACSQLDRSEFTV